MPHNHDTFLGIDLGGTAIKAGLVSRDWRLLNCMSVPTNAEEGREAVVNRLVCLVGRLQCCGAHAPGVKGIGIGCPGPLDVDAGVILVAPNLPGWENVPLRRLIERQTGIPTSLINDANAAAWAEKCAGAARRVKSFVLYTLGTGIGGGIVMDGKLVEGYTGTGGELGHMVVVPGGRQCGCGNKGRLEAYSSGPAIVRDYLRRAGAACRPGAGLETVARKPSPPLKKGDSGGFSASVDSKLVCSLARNGDLAARAALSNAARYLGIAIGNIVNALNPELVLIGGGLAGAGETILTPVRAAAMPNVLPPLRKRVRIVRAQLGNSAGIVGAAGWAMNEYRGARR